MTITRGQSSKGHSPPSPPPTVDGETPICQTSSSEENMGSETFEPMQPLNFCFNPAEYAKYPKIGTRCDPAKAVEIIKDLNGPELSWFRKHTQFRHFFHMPLHENRKVMGMWLLLLRTVCTDRRNELWFVVNGCPIRYSLREHALISGLSCRRYPPYYDAKAKHLGSMRFVEKYFGEKKPEVKDVEQKLKSMKSPTTDRLKMALLYFLAVVIKGKSKTVKGSIDTFILKVVDDLDFCRTFCWGRYTFDLCLTEVWNMLNRCNGSVNKNVTLPGFILPLEILAFECISPLKTTFRENIVDAEEQCPRMCKKKFKDGCTKGFNLGEIYDALGTSKDIKSILVPHGDEEILMARITTEFDDDLAGIDPIIDGWNKILIQQNDKIWWEDLFKLDVESRTDGEHVPEPKASDANPSNHGSLNELRKFEKRIMRYMEKGFEKIETKFETKFEEFDKRLKSVQDFVFKKNKDPMDFGWDDYTHGEAGAGEPTIVKGGHCEVDADETEVVEAENEDDTQVAEDEKVADESENADETEVVEAENEDDTQVAEAENVADESENADETEVVEAENEDDTQVAEAEKVADESESGEEVAENESDKEGENESGEEVAENVAEVVAEKRRCKKRSRYLKTPFTGGKRRKNA